MSIATYRARVVAGLGEQGVAVCDVPAAQRGTPDVDLLWDPGLGMRRVAPVIARASLPLAVTVHGLLGFVLSDQEAGDGGFDVARRLVQRMRIRASWRSIRGRVGAVITPSAYGAREVQEVLGIDASRVHAIHHGVDHETFRPLGARDVPSRPYFVVVAQHQPKKNVERILAAHAALPAEGRPALVAVVPGLPATVNPHDGVELRRAAASPSELAALFRGALALVLPSLHETFGMPLLEAMACGCPVLTSNTTACPEVVGDAGLVVDPRDVVAIRDAMVRLATDAGLRARLHDHAVARAASFTWERCASGHAAVLAGVAAAHAGTGVAR
ncbi:MAG: glycosyltransferase family 4 protein [Planctomycetes bacterium]|nr:glycosyltransferase family 4 protein [Planctomycetota bacterium]